MILWVKCAGMGELEQINALWRGGIVMVEAQDNAGMFQVAIFANHSNSP